VDGIVTTMVDQASFLVQIAGSNILVDPVPSERASAGERRKILRLPQ
jgi:L-ascorbate metabolism protein UlaG (beta-lactamase superfamily)